MLGGLILLRAKKRLLGSCKRGKGKGNVRAFQEAGLCIHLSSLSIYIPLLISRGRYTCLVPWICGCWRDTHAKTHVNTHTHTFDDTVAAPSEGAVAGGTHGGKLPARDFYRDFYWTRGAAQHF